MLHVLRDWLFRSLPEHESYLVVMNFGSETETVILSNVIRNIKNKLYVYVPSENSEYNQGYLYNNLSFLTLNCYFNICIGLILLLIYQLSFNLLFFFCFQKYCFYNY